MNRFLFFHPQCIWVFTDGAIRPEPGISGLAAVVRGEKGQILTWFSQRAGAMTCNEAEYAAVQFALESVQPLRPQIVHLFSDSQVVVQQMTGIASTRSRQLKQAQFRVRELLANFREVHFHHIPREKNRLADALANEIADGDWA